LARRLFQSMQATAGKDVLLMTFLFFFFTPNTFLHQCRLLVLFIFVPAVIKLFARPPAACSLIHFQRPIIKSCIH
jgi:hypothetical protein